MIAALYVQKDGCYFGLDGVDPWDETRDARLYDGPWPVVAHPPCQRWGRFWHGSTRKPHQFKLGEDAGCFAAACISVWRFGGVIEHVLLKYKKDIINQQLHLKRVADIAIDLFGMTAVISRATRSLNREDTSAPHEA